VSPPQRGLALQVRLPAPILCAGRTANSQIVSRRSHTSHQGDYNHNLRGKNNDVAPTSTSADTATQRGQPNVPDGTPRVIEDPQWHLPREVLRLKSGHVARWTERADATGTQRAETKGSRPRPRQAATDTPRPPPRPNTASVEAAQVVETPAASGQARDRHDHTTLPAQEGTQKRMVSRTEPILRAEFVAATRPSTRAGFPGRLPHRGPRVDPIGTPLRSPRPPEGRPAQAILDARQMLIIAGRDQAPARGGTGGLQIGDTLPGPLRCERGDLGQGSRNDSLSPASLGRGHDV